MRREPERPPVFSGRKAAISARGLCVLLLGFVILLSAGPLFGQDLIEPYTSLNLGRGFGARALSMGGAFIAVADGIPAVGYNPAGLARIVKPEFAVGAGYGGQAIGVPYGLGSGGYFYLPPASAYDFNFTAFSFDYVGAAFSGKAGKLPFVFCVSYHRDLSFNSSYAYSLRRQGPNYDYFLPDGTSVLGGTYDGTEEHSRGYQGSLNVITASLAFRVIKNVYFGLNVNFWKGNAPRHEIVGTRFTISEGGVELLNGEGSDIDDAVIEFSGGTNVDIGMLWETRFFSAGFVLKTEFALNEYTVSSYDSSWTFSPGGSFKDRYQYSTEHPDEWPVQLGIGLALKPGRPWTFSVAFMNRDGGASYVNPDIQDELRTGAEYVISAGRLTVPVRAGWFLSGTDSYYASGKRRKLSGFTFGTGLAWKNLALDIAALFHSKSTDISYWKMPELDPVERSYWRLAMSLSYKLGKQP
jgi:hypothetical protein